jgi:paraquat-inducible protein B
MTMAKQANRMMIGGFVVIAVFLLAASVVIFGSGKFFQKTNKYVMYFDGSIKGLEIGAPVLFRASPSVQFQISPFALTSVRWKPKFRSLSKLSPIDWKL